MTNIALSIDVRTTPGERDAFAARLKRHGEFCVANEPGCLSFFVMTPLDADDRVMAFEVYADKVALEAHDASDHMAVYRKDTAHMVAARVRVTGPLV
ncbi:MAG: antibiotic biosynthesis monooxygenase [Chitinophagales bacterium]|nr:antibiotic biosynthesis monooxygenase [Hyphomicrobiales bacterium]